MPSKAEATSKAVLDTKTAPPSIRDHLINVGLELMRRHGYRATGLQEILHAAGVPKGSFYHHFGSKEEFTAALLDHYAAMAGEHCQEALGNARQAPLKRLRRYFEDLIRVAGPSGPIPGCFMGSLSLEVAAVSSLLQGCLSASFARWQTAVAAVLREAVEKGDLAKSTKPEALAGFVLNSWEGALLRSQADKSDAPLKDFLKYMFDESLAK